MSTDDGYRTGEDADGSAAEASAEAAVVAVVPVAPGRQVDHSWGKARVIATVTVVGGAVTTWVEDEVRWDVAHDAGPHGSHHGRIAAYLRERGAQVVVAAHMGPPMAHTLGRMGLAVTLGAAGDAEAAVLAAVARFEREGPGPAGPPRPTGPTLPLLP